VAHAKGCYWSGKRNSGPSQSAHVAFPPKRPLLRLSDVLGPGSSWRPRVVPRREVGSRHAHGGHGLSTPAGADKEAKPAPAPRAAADKKAKRAPAPRAAAPATVGDEPVLPVQGGEAAPKNRGTERVVPAVDAGPTATGAGKAARRHAELASGVVPAAGARIDWASLLKRVFWEDVLACPCGGRRRIVSDVQDRDAVIAILAHVGLPTEAPPIARARAPAELGFGFEEAPRDEGAHAARLREQGKGEVRPRQGGAWASRRVRQRKAGRSWTPSPLRGRRSRQDPLSSAYAPRRRGPWSSSPGRHAFSASQMDQAGAGVDGAPRGRSAAGSACWARSSG
jgi:hypothetical protein